jgi:uncharacterized protein
MEPTAPESSATQSTPPSGVSRRGFLLRAAGLAAVGVGGYGLLRGWSPRAPRRSAGAYGPLQPTPDETSGAPLLLLPEGFRLVTSGWTQDPLECSARTPGAHDGMAAFAGPDGHVLLVRNHEVSAGPGQFSEAAPVYDPGAGGGTTTLSFDPEAGKFLASWASLTGTLRNCAGGPTPWGSWLTCEETLEGPGKNGLTRDHGWVFEVPAGRGQSADPEPIRGMGRFMHEAAAVDPDGRAVYLTEDRMSAGFYRYLPERAGDLRSGGPLEMLAVRGEARVDLRRGQQVGARLPVTWVPIADPERAHSEGRGRDHLGVFSQGLAGGGAVFSRLEGAWTADDRVYFTSTTGGKSAVGQVWALHPEAELLELIYESTDSSVVCMPDNLTVSPRGGLVLCEDPLLTPIQIHALGPDGQVSPLAQNAAILDGQRGVHGDYTSSEFAGATFSPDGRWLFFNLQQPGITCAITGPWERGPL